MVDTWWGSIIFEIKISSDNMWFALEFLCTPHVDLDSFMLGSNSTPNHVSIQVLFIIFFFLWKIVLLKSARRGNIRALIIFEGLALDIKQERKSDLFKSEVHRLAYHTFQLQVFPLSFLHTLIVFKKKCVFLSRT